MQLTFTVKRSKTNIDPMRYTQFLSCDTPQVSTRKSLPMKHAVLFFLILGGPENFTVDKYRRFDQKPLLDFYVFLHVYGSIVLLLNRIAFAFWRGASHIAKKN